MRWDRTWAFVALVVTLSACSGSSEDPSLLTETEQSMTIPGSARWGVGEPCVGGDCAFALGLDAAAELCWLRTDRFDVSEDSRLGPGHLGVFVDEYSRLKGPVDDAIVFSVRGRTVDAMKEALEDGFELIVGYRCEKVPGRGEQVAHVVAVDSRGRIAGIGDGANQIVTVPLAQAAVAARAGTAEELLLEWIVP